MGITAGRPESVSGASGSAWGCVREGAGGGGRGGWVGTHLGEEQGRDDRAISLAEGRRQDRLRLIRASVRAGSISTAPAILAEAGRLTACPCQRPRGLDLRRARDSCGGRTAYGLSVPASARARSPPRACSVRPLSRPLRPSRISRSSRPPRCHPKGKSKTAYGLSVPASAWDRSPPRPRSLRPSRSSRQQLRTWTWNLRTWVRKDENT